MENNSDHGNNVVNKEQKTAEEIISRHFNVKSFNPVIINSVKDAMHDFANQQTSALLEQVRVLRNKYEYLDYNVDDNGISAFSIAKDLSELISKHS